MDVFGVIVIFLVGLLAGAGIGKLGAKFVQALINKKILKGAEEVLAGKRKNEFDLDGRKMEVNKFKIRDKDDKEILVDLKGKIIKEENQAQNGA